MTSASPQQASASFSTEVQQTRRPVVSKVTNFWFLPYTGLTHFFLFSQQSATVAVINHGTAKRSTEPSRPAPSLPFCGPSLESSTAQATGGAATGRVRTRTRIRTQRGELSCLSIHLQPDSSEATDLCDHKTPTKMAAASPTANLSTEDLRDELDIQRTILESLIDNDHQDAETSRQINETKNAIAQLNRTLKARMTKGITSSCLLTLAWRSRPINC